MNIGFRVRVHRHQHHLSLRQLAARAGLSVGFLSQVERDLTSPSISSLKQIANALGIKVADLLADASEDHPVLLRRKDRPVWDLSHIRYELLATGNGRSMEPQLVTFEPGAESGDHPVTHEGEEFGMILSGRAECWIGDDFFELDTGDCVYFQASTAHRMRNPGDKVCVWLHVVSPPSF